MRVGAASSFLLVSGDFVETGGMDRANYALAEYLAHAGREVHLVAFRVAEKLAGLPTVRWHRVPKPLGSYTVALPLLDRFGRYHARRVSGHGGRVIVNGGSSWWADVNWVHYVHAAHQPEVRSSRLRRWIAHRNHRQWKADEARALRDARVIITNSNRTTRDVVEHFEIPESNVLTVYYGIDPNRFRPADAAERAALREKIGWSGERRVAVFVGALSDRRKGFDTLFEAWSKLCHQDWDVDLLVVGAGAEIPIWQDRIRRRGLTTRIHFVGFHERVEELLRGADVFVAPTRYEAYGLAAHEAVCCGVPAVITAASGFAERYPPNLRDLLIHDPESVDELIRVLRMWQDQAKVFCEDTLKFGEQLRARTWQHMAEEFVAAIGEDART